MKYTKDDVFRINLGKNLKESFKDACNKRGKNMTKVTKVLLKEYIDEYRPRSPKGKTWINFGKEDVGTKPVSAKTADRGSSSSHPIY